MPEAMLGRLHAEPEPFTERSSRRHDPAEPDRQDPGLLRASRFATGCMVPDRGKFRVPGSRAEVRTQAADAAAIQRPAVRASRPGAR